MPVTESEAQQSSSPRQRAPGVVIKIAGALVVGALGSGLWEIAFKDAFLWLGNRLLTLVSTVWHGYVDQLHKQIGSSHSDLLVVPLFAFAVVSIFGALIFSLARLFRTLHLAERHLRGDDIPPRRSNEERRAELQRLRRKARWVLMPMSVAAAFMLSVQAANTIYTRNASNWSARSIEILAPYIEPNQVLLLRSKLRAVDSASKFYALEDELQATAKRVRIDLPSFTSIRGKSGA